MQTEEVGGELKPFAQGAHEMDSSRELFPESHDTHCVASIASFALRPASQTIQLSVRGVGA